MAYARHTPAGPPGPGGRSMAACAFLGRACTLIRRVLRAQVYAIAAHSSPRCPLRGAQRSAGTVATRVHRGMHLKRGRSRAAAAQLRWDGGKQDADRLPLHRPIPPFCVTTATPSLRHRHRRTASTTACLIPSRFSPTVAIATKSPLCRHTRPDFSAVFRGHPLRLRAAAPRVSPSLLSGIDATRLRRYVGVPAPLGTGSPPEAATPSRLSRRAGP